MATLSNSEEAVAGSSVSEDQVEKEMQNLALEKKCAEEMRLTRLL